MNLDLLSPRLLSSYAVGALEAVPGDAPPELRRVLEGVVDPDLPEGTHLRLLPSTTLGLPLAPWLLWPVDASPIEGLDKCFTWRGASVTVTGEVTPDRPREEILGYYSKPLPDEVRLVAVEITPGDVESLALLTTDAMRVSAVRTKPPFCVTGPDIRFLRIRATGPFKLQGWLVQNEQLHEMAGRPPVERLGAPAVQGRWYAGDPSLEDPWNRVRRGAPRRKTPVDQPAGALAAWPDPAAAEEARVGCFAENLIETFRYLAMEDPALPPDQRYSPRDAMGRATLNPGRALLLQSMDPGAARLLGLMTTLKPIAPFETVDRHRRTCWVAGAMFLRPPADTMERDDGWLSQLTMELSPGFRDVQAELRARSVQLRGYLSLAFVAPPPDPPDVGAVELDESAWMRDGAHPGNAFRQGFRLPDPPVAVLAAMARREDGNWKSRSRLMAPANRRAPMLLGTPRPDQSPPALPPYARLYDHAIPGVRAPWRYRVAIGDLFGRFGRSREVNVPAPGRPLVPQPIIECRTLPRLTVPRGSAPASPGTIKLVVHVPTFDDLAAGSRPIALVHIAGVPETTVASQPANRRKLELSIPLPECAPPPSSQQQRKFDLKVWFENEGGVHGKAATTGIVAIDPRPPPVPETAAGLVWTSRPGPSTEVELGVRFPAPPGTRWRVYISDLNALASGKAMPGVRAEAADAGRKLVKSGRDKFRLLTAQPVDVIGGELAFDTTLPRALRTVQFLRFVPVNAHGVEADFKKCPLLPVAVPSDRRPPSPRIAVDASGGSVTLKVLAEGLDLETLRQVEPGLFKKTPSPDARAPEFRLRRATGAVADPIYAREVFVGPAKARTATLKWNLATKQFEASFIDKVTEPYVRYFYWAEVRMPAERRLKKGVVEKPFPAGAIRPVDDTQLRDAPGEFSDASPAAMAMVVPEKTAALKPEQVKATVTNLGDSWRLEVGVSGGPVTSPRAIAAYSINVYLQTDDADLRLAGTVTLDTGSASFTATTASPAPTNARVGLVLIDPIGRTSKVLFKKATRS